MRAFPRFRLLSVLLLIAGLGLAGGFAPSADAQSDPVDCSWLYGDCSEYLDYCSWYPGTEVTLGPPCDDGNGHLAYVACGRDIFFCRAT